MTRASKTRSALFTSIISLLLCVSMLVGTTFAWFTDVAETGLNQIIAGNLDVALLNAKGENVENSEKLFTTPALWEPGAVAFAQLKVANKGTLDLQASMSINYEDVNYIVHEGKNYVLSQVLQYAVIEVSDVANMSREALLEAAKTSGTKGSLSDYDFEFKLEPGEESSLQTLVVFWEPNDNDVDNIYNVNNNKTTSNKKPLQINLGVRVFATQLGGEDYNEEDSFGKDYDVNAGWNGKVEEESPAVKPEIPPEGGDPVIPDVTVNASTVGTQTPVSATVDGQYLNKDDKVTLTVKDSSAADSNITLTGSGLVYDVEVTNQDGKQLPATITLTVPESLDVTKVVHYGSTQEELNFDAEVKDGVKTLTFSMTSYSPVVVYHANQAMIDGVYYDTLADALAAAQDGTTVKLLADVGETTLVNSVTLNRNGYAIGNITVPTGKTLTIDTLNGGVVVTADSGSVTVKDGVVYELPVKDSQSTYKQPTVIKTDADLFAFANEVNVNKKNFDGEAVVLANDINLKNAAWTPIGATGSTMFAGIFDGQGHTISNLNVDTSAMGKDNKAAAGLFGWTEGYDAKQPVAFKNLTIDGVTVKSGKYAGAVIGYTSGTVTIENCTVKNATISGTRVGGVAGFQGTGVTVDNCHVNTAALTGSESVSEVVGFTYDGITNCTSTNVTMTISGQEALEYALKNAGAEAVITLADGTYKLYEKYGAMANKNITFQGGKGAIIDNSAQVNVNGVQDLTNTTIIFDGVTVKWSDANDGYQGLKNPGKVVYKNCDIYGTQFMYSGADFTGCTFYTEDSYAVYTRASGTYTFTDCVFYTGGRAIMMYCDGSITVDLTATDCTFYDDGTYSSKDKAAIETGNGGGASTYTITIKNCTAVKGFEANSSTSPLWGNKDNMDTDHLNVTIDDVKVY